MRVEPRTFLANERTFLKWIRLAALASITGLALISLNHEPFSGLLLLFLSLILSIRVYQTYMKRIDIIINRKQGTWVDEFDSKLLMVTLLLPMVTYVIYVTCFKKNDFWFVSLFVFFSRFCCLIFI